MQAELEQAFGVAVQVRGIEGAQGQDLRGALVLVLPSKFARLRAVLPTTIEIVPLQISAIPGQMEYWLGKRPLSALIGVASAWMPFLDLSRTMLVAAGVDADCLLIRDRR